MLSFDTFQAGMVHRIACLATPPLATTTPPPTITLSPTTTTMLTSLSTMSSQKLRKKRSCLLLLQKRTQNSFPLVEKWLNQANVRQSFALGWKPASQPTCQAFLPTDFNCDRQCRWLCGELRVSRITRVGSLW